MVCLTAVSCSHVSADDNAVVGDSGGDEDDVNNNNEEEAIPVPQVMIGPDGSIIIDESTTTIETTASKKAKDDLFNSSLVSCWVNFTICKCRICVMKLKIFIATKLLAQLEYSIGP